MANGDVLSRYVANRTTPKPAFTAPSPVIPNSSGPPDDRHPSVAVATVDQTPYVPPNEPAGSSGVDPTTFAADWYKSFFAQYGLPNDVQSSIVNILKQYAADPSTAQTLAQQYLRTTPWYATTFPGFSSGVTNGLFTDETGYRSYLDTVNNVYNQYLGRHISGDEVTALLKEGANPQLVANRFQGQAWVNANGQDSQYLAGAFGEGRLSGDQLTAAGNENAGIDTAQGQAVQLMLQKASQRAQTVIQGALARPGLSLGANGVSAPGLRGTQQTPDIAA